MPGAQVYENDGPCFDAAKETQGQIDDTPPLFTESDACRAGDLGRFLLLQQRAEQRQRWIQAKRGWRVRWSEQHQHWRANWHRRLRTWRRRKGLGGAASGGAAGSASGGSASGGVTSGTGGSSSGATGGSSTAKGTGGLAGGGSGGGGAASGGSGSGGVTSGAGGSSSGATGGSSAATGTGGLAGGGSGGGGAATGGSGGGGAAGTGGTGGSQSCPSLPGAPTGTPPLPSAAQLSYQRTEMTAFIHYGMATYDGTEQGNPSDSPSIFNPTKLDATSVGQWVSSLKAAGFRQAMLVTKHSVGFTLWPSKYTDYSVKSSPWMSGKGDVVQLFTDAMQANDMRVAIYLSPGTRSTRARSPTTRRTSRTRSPRFSAMALPTRSSSTEPIRPPGRPFNWKSVFQLIKQTQPNILIWAGPEIVHPARLRTCNGLATRTGRHPHDLEPRHNELRRRQDLVSVRMQHIEPPAGLVLASRTRRPWRSPTCRRSTSRRSGMNCTLNFNVPPSQTGEFDPKDVALLQQFGRGTRASTRRICSRDSR